MSDLATNFVEYLERRFRDNGTRATVARDARRPPNESHGSHGVVGPFLPAGDAAWDLGRRWALYMTAGWYARNHRTAPVGADLGETCRVAVNAGKVTDNTVEKRLLALTRVSERAVAVDHIGRILEVVGPTDWPALFDAVADWPIAHDRITARWLESFYRDQPTD